MEPHPSPRRVAVFSDLHADLGSTREALNIARGEQCDVLVCLGDLVGYGPNPCEVVDLVRVEVDVVMRGNHDTAVRDDRELSEMTPRAAEALREHRNLLTRERIDWLSGLPSTARLGEATFTHASIPEPERFRYPMRVPQSTRDPSDVFVPLEEVTAAMETPLLFVGHSHKPCLFREVRSGQIQVIRPSRPSYDLAEPPLRTIVDVGSAALPRPSRNRRSLVVWEVEGRRVRFVRF